MDDEQEKEHKKNPPKKRLRLRVSFVYPYSVYPNLVLDWAIGCRKSELHKNTTGTVEACLVIRGS